MDIGIIGTGDVAISLAQSWTKSGHQIHIGSAQKATATTLAKELDPHAAHIQGGSISETVAFSQIQLIAVTWRSVKKTLKSAGSLDKTILIDATNPYIPGMGLTLGLTTSAAEQISAWRPAARVVKAFNTLQPALIQDPYFNGQPATMLYCGDDDEAKFVVHRLAEEMGFKAMDAGPLKMARQLEPLAYLWEQLSSRQKLETEIGMVIARR